MLHGLIITVTVNSYDQRCDSVDVRNGVDMMISSFYKKLSCHKETMQLLHGSVLAKYDWETIFCRHYRSIFDHCDVISLQSYQFR